MASARPVSPGSSAWWGGEALRDQGVGEARSTPVEAEARPAGHHFHSTDRRFLKQAFASASRPRPEPQRTSTGSILILLKTLRTGRNASKGATPSRLDVESFRWV